MMKDPYYIYDQKANTLVIVQNDCIYIGRPKSNVTDRLKNGSFVFTDEFLKSLFSIPYNYIKTIEYNVNQKRMVIKYGQDSEEEIKFKEEGIKEKIFDHIKSDTANFRFITKSPNLFTPAKPQWFSLLIITGLFAWSFYLALQMERGYDYELMGRGFGVAGLALSIANLGITKMVIGYIVLISIIITLIIIKLKNRSEINLLYRKLK